MWVSQGPRHSRPQHGDVGGRAKTTMTRPELVHALRPRWPRAERLYQRNGSQQSSPFVYFVCFVVPPKLHGISATIRKTLEVAGAVTKRVNGPSPAT